VTGRRDQSGTFTAVAAEPSSEALNQELLRQVILSTDQMQQGQSATVVALSRRPALGASTPTVELSMRAAFTNTQYSTATVIVRAVETAATTNGERMVNLNKAVRTAAALCLALTGFLSLTGLLAGQIFIHPLIAGILLIASLGFIIMSAKS
jgi:hypothetical protein